MQHLFHRSRLPVLTTILALTLAAASSAQPGYFRYTAITPPIYPYALGNDGSMISETFGDSFNISAAVYQNGDLESFAVPGAFETYPIDINAAGRVVGAAADENYETVAGFIHTRSGKLTTYSYPGALWTNFSGINDAGTAIGVWYSDTGFGSFLLDTKGTVTPLNVPGYETVFWKDLNNAGTVLGQDGLNGYLLNGGQVTPFPLTQSQNGFGNVITITNRGQVLYVRNDPVPVPGRGTLFAPSSYVRDADGTLHPVAYPGDLPGSIILTWYDGTPVTLQLVQRLGTFALGMNDRGQVLGGVQAIYGTIYQGHPIYQFTTTVFLATPGGTPN